MAKFVFRFGDPEVKGAPKELLGGKGAGLFEMTRLGIPVPPGFTITTEVCRRYYAGERKYPEGFEAEVKAALGAIEKDLGLGFGNAANPLLVSVRSGGRASMPGMMDTILNLGLNDVTVEGLAKSTQNRRFALDAYRRLLTMYGDVVMDVPRERFDEALAETKKKIGNPHLADHEIPAEVLGELVITYKKIIAEVAKEPFPQDVHAQLWGAVGAVVRSWMNKRAITYRKMHDIPEDWGTAVNVQAMVFGNMGDDCATGVAFTRNPSTGERKIYGEYLPNAQGEDVVAGIRTPRALAAAASPPGKEAESLERAQPAAYAELIRHFAALEKHFRDMQDIEFTIQKGRVWILQTRTGKRTAKAGVRAAVEMVAEGIISKKEALLRVEPSALDQLLHPRVPDPVKLATLGIHAIATGLPASPGAASGKIVFHADHAQERAAAGEAVILVRRETSPDDIHGMQAARGILTATGGMTSHAAVVARGMGKCCVAGCGAVHVDYQRARMIVKLPSGDSVELAEGDVITLDGTLGKVYRGEIEVEAAAVAAEFETFMGWADEVRKLHVRANADTPASAKAARDFGAQGIGLTRTEHMFFAEDRIEAVRCMFLADDPAVRAKFVEKIGAMQEEDFIGIFRAMHGLPVTIRLLDWPLHEFMPKETADFEQLAKVLGVPVDSVRRKADGMHELNPMLGHRGVRLGLTRPDVYGVQTRAIIAAAARVTAEGLTVLPEIMIPVVAMAEEFARVREVVDRVAKETLAKFGQTLRYEVGTMIELPRACLVADDLAKTAEFFSFGTNDLTQTAWGISRDDAGKFLPAYQSDELKLLAVDPFASLDQRGVGELIKIACERGRKTRPALHVGICGEHGGDPASIRFCAEAGLDYVSCSPFRVPIARLAAAHAALTSGATLSSQA